MVMILPLDYANDFNRLRVLESAVSFLILRCPGFTDFSFEFPYEDPDLEYCHSRCRMFVDFPDTPEFPYSRLVYDYNETLHTWEPLAYDGDPVFLTLGCH